uniref:Uncharacterized protein n=1 Tax=uncultured bacterium contig00017 TaxID=1181508 RepID=A0A806KAL9_9BACT|nr:hypothetical protein [uncultured bacterium contig00017]
MAGGDKPRPYSIPASFLFLYPLKSPCIKASPASSIILL